MKALDFKILESAVVSLPGRDDPISLGIASAPRLRRYAWGAGDAGMPPIQLTHLKITLAVKADSAIAIFKHCWQLLEADLYYDDETNVAFVQHAVVTHNHLQSLRVLFKSGTGLFDVLKLPALRSLELKYDAYRPRLIRSYEKLLHLLDRSKCMLDTLFVDDLQPAKNALPSAQLVASPWLRHLHELKITRTLDPPEELLPIIFNHLPHLTRLYIMFYDNVPTRVEKMFLIMVQGHIQNHSLAARPMPILESNNDDVLSSLNAQGVTLELGLSKAGFDISRLLRA
ncbi:hypothetical protein HGRIS_011457 [Hohenbuehelia grisea]|uniref:Uncharacterized protein n=1 Tax=Hohenbuehelia grisea TaxID=104357 RepID=A0ABR3JW39_9AGAR